MTRNALSNPLWLRSLIQKINDSALFNKTTSPLSRPKPQTTSPLSRTSPAMAVMVVAASHQKKATSRLI
jgi:hypothetical protein